MIRVTPFKALITLLITFLLSPLPLQVGFPLKGALQGLYGASITGFYLGGSWVAMWGFEPLNMGYNYSYSILSHTVDDITPA